MCCRVSGVSRAGYYEYRGRPLSATALRRVWLSGLITEIHTRSRQTYGVRRVHAEMTLGMGVRVSKPTIEKLMRIQGLQGIPKRKGIKHFKRELTTREGKLYCCAILDAFSRKIVGWSVDSVQNSNLVVNALDMAIKNRNPAPGAVVHSDHGTQGNSLLGHLASESNKPVYYHPLAPLAMPTTVRL